MIIRSAKENYENTQNIRFFTSIRILIERLRQQ